VLDHLLARSRTLLLKGFVDIDAVEVDAVEARRNDAAKIGVLSAEVDALPAFEPVAHAMRLGPGAVFFTQPIGRQRLPFGAPIGAERLALANRKIGHDEAARTIRLGLESLDVLRRQRHLAVLLCEIDDHHVGLDSGQLVDVDAVKLIVPAARGGERPVHGEAGDIGRRTVTVWPGDRKNHGKGGRQERGGGHLLHQ